MKKTCGALVIGLMITTNVYAVEKELTACEAVNASISGVLNKPSHKHFTNEKECKLIMDFVRKASSNYLVNNCDEKAAYNSGYKDGVDSAAEVYKSKKPLSFSTKQESNIIACPPCDCGLSPQEKQRLQDAEFEGERRGFYRGQMQR